MCIFFISFYDDDYFLSIFVVVVVAVYTVYEKKMK